MGFEPFIPKRPVAPQERLAQTGGREGSREERVMALARLLHERGLTSSMTDAKRLAEGMVDVEKKVIAQAPTVQAGQGQDKHSKALELPGMGTTGTLPAKPSAARLSLNEDFSAFVAQVAQLPHEELRSRVSVPVMRQERRSPARQQEQAAPGYSRPTVMSQTTPPTDAPVSRVTYGRDEERHSIAEVPHVRGQKQVYYEEAPPLTQMRGYSGPKTIPVDFPSQQFDQFKRQKADGATQNTAATAVTAADAGIAVKRTETTPERVVVEERVVVVDDAIPDVPSQPATPASPIPPVVAAPAVAAPSSKQEAARGPATKESARQESIDLFEFFKKKT